MQDAPKAVPGTIVLILIIFYSDPGFEGSEILKFSKKLKAAGVYTAKLTNGTKV